MAKFPFGVIEGGDGKSEVTEDEAVPHDPVVEECIADAMAMCEGIMTPEEILEHRRFLTLFITTHPMAAPIYERLRVRRLGKRSGDVAKDDVVLGAELDLATAEGERQ
jgi:hypothetical protein